MQAVGLPRRCQDMVTAHLTGSREADKYWRRTPRRHWRARGPKEVETLGYVGRRRVDEGFEARFVLDRQEWEVSERER